MLGIIPECAKVFHRKAYYSQQRNKPIMMDVVIELYRPGLDTPYLVWVWECKDYSTQVPVDDVEEFHAKLEQIKVHKTKGTIICRNGFQQGAINYAQSLGIGLARMLPDGSSIRMQEEVRANRIPRRFAELALTQDSTDTFFNSHFFGLLSTGEGINSLREMLISELDHLA